MFPPNFFLFSFVFWGIIVNYHRTMVDLTFFLVTGDNFYIKGVPCLQFHFFEWGNYIVCENKELSWCFLPLTIIKSPLDVIIEGFPFNRGNPKGSIFLVFSQMGSLNFENILWLYCNILNWPSVAEGYFKQISRSFVAHFFVLLRYLSSSAFFEIISHWFYIGLIFSDTGFNKEIWRGKHHVFLV
jgi:hypothetical protein